MNKLTLKALKNSIEHWERLANDKSKPREKPYGGQCALCSMFVVQNKNGSCDGCPVREQTGFDYCSGSPYQKAYYEYHEHGKHHQKFLAAAKRELRFLRSLLPKKGQNEPR